MTSQPILNITDLAWIPPGLSTPLWEGVSFELTRGQLLNLFGESGSGKSTLLRTIVALEHAAHGKVHWHGEPVTPDNIRLFRSQVLYLHQSPLSIAPTVAENLDFPRQILQHLDPARPTLSIDDQRHLLHRLGLQNIDLRRRFENFSLGEQQRIAIVRSLTSQPEVLLLDEPTASLDHKSARAVEDLILEHIDNGMAAIWITHDKEQRTRIGGSPLSIDTWRTHADAAPTSDTNSARDKETPQ